MTQPSRNPAIPQACEDQAGNACAPSDCALDGAHYCTRESALPADVCPLPSTLINLRRADRRIE